MTSMTPTGIAYDDRGQGDPALLFLPGWCGPRTLFDPIRARVEHTRRHRSRLARTRGFQARRRRLRRR